MSSWCAWPHIRIVTSSMSVGPSAGARPLGRPRERRRDRVGIGAVERDARDAVAGRLVGEHAHRRLLGDRRRQRGLVVLTQKIAGSRRAAHRLIASCHSPSDDPPSPMNETATRADPSRQNAIAMPAIGQRRDRERRRRRKDAPVEDRRCADPCRRSAGRPWPSARSAPSAPSPDRAASRASTPRSRMTGATTSPSQRPSSPR